LTSVTIGSSVTTINIQAFGNCSELTSVTNLNPTPQDISYISMPAVFYNVTLSNLTLRVPAAALSAYQAADVWKDFGTIVALTD
jgi:hypothetical protein